MFSIPGKSPVTITPAAERQIAGLLPQALGETARLLADGRPAAAALQEIEQRLLAAGFAQVDYIALCDGETLAPLAAARPGSRLFAAARIGRTRLIDNWPVG